MAFSVYQKKNDSCLAYQFRITIRIKIILLPGKIQLLTIIVLSKLNIPNVIN